MFATRPVLSVFRRCSTTVSSARGFHAGMGTRREGDDVFIVAAARTPIGKFNGVLKSLSAIELGSAAVQAVVEKSGLEDRSEITEIYMGQAIQANHGHSPARQVALSAGLPVTTDGTTINKGSVSAMKAVILAVQNIQTGVSDVIVAGGMESMSSVSSYLAQNRNYVHDSFTESILKDGICDIYGDMRMGSYAENTARKFNISRDAQDAFAFESYRRALRSQETGKFDFEIVPVSIRGALGTASMVSEDEEPTSGDISGLAGLQPAFEDSGTITAGNSGSLSDGAAAVLLVSESRLDRSDDLIRPLGVIVSSAECATAPCDFTTAPSLVIPKALMRARLKTEDIARFELDELYSCAALANQELLGLDLDKVNMKGDAVALGHPTGASGCRILVTLLYSLNEGEYGVAATSNGGGAASAIVVQRM